MTPREHFEKTGKLNSRLRKGLSFRLRSMMGNVGFSSDARGWSSLGENGVLMNHWLHVGSAESVEGLKIYEFVFWRLYVIFGFI